MPSVNSAQRRLFAIAEHHPDELYKKNKGLANLTHKTLHDFAATKGLSHMADGGTTSNTTFQQSEPVSKTARAAWMEKIPIRKPVEEKPVTAMADGGWMKKAFAHAGEPGHSLHASLNIPKDEKIPAGRLNAATHSKSSHLRHQAQAAKNAHAR